MTARHLRMTDSDKARKVAKQFERRLNLTHPSLEFKLGRAEYWKLYNKFFKQQNGCCAICSKPWNSNSKRRMALDHKHGSLEFRGLLCYSCNTKLGFVEKFFVEITRYLGWEITT